MRTRAVASFVTGLLLVASAHVAHAAGGINLSWTECGSFGLAQKNFACNSNANANFLFASAIPPAPLPELTGAVIVIDIQTNQPALGNWWLIETGKCRPASAISVNFNFTAFTNCLDPWQGTVPPSFTYTSPLPSMPDRARVVATGMIPGFTPILTSDEMYVCYVAITNAKTVGTGSCSGCSDGACIVLNSILLTQTAGLGDYLITNPIVRQYVTWQAGGGSVAGGCPQATPARNATWGSIKSMYR